MPMINGMGKDRARTGNVRKSLRQRRVINRLGQDEIGPGCSLRRKFLISSPRSGGFRLRAQPHEEGGGLADIRTGMIDPGVEALLDQLDQAGRHQVVIIHGVRIIADGGGVAHHDKHIAHTQGMRCQQVALHAQQVAPAGGEMQDGFNAHSALDQVADRPGAHAHARHGAVGHVDHIRAGFGQQAGAGQ